MDSWVWYIAGVLTLPAAWFALCMIDPVLYGIGKTYALWRSTARISGWRQPFKAFLDWKFYAMPFRLAWDRAFGGWGSEGGIVEVTFRNGDRWKPWFRYRCHKKQEPTDAT